MTFFERLLYLFGLKPPSSPYEIKIAPELFAVLDHLAAQEQRSLETLIDDLLHTALTERLVAVEYLQHWEALTPREQQVAALTCLGCTNQEIAGRLIISPNTVRTHIRNILYKLNINSKVELREMLAGWDFQLWVAGQDLPPNTADTPISSSPAETTP